MNIEQKGMRVDLEKYKIFKIDLIRFPKGLTEEMKGRRKEVKLTRKERKKQKELESVERVKDEHM